MSFEDAIATMPAWVQYWVMWISAANIGALIVFAIWRATRRDAAILFVVTAAMFISMQALYAQVGLVRLLGLVHIIFWVPLVIYLIARIRSGLVPNVPRIAMIVLVATLIGSLAFDVADVARWLLGERGSMLPAT